MADRDEVAAAAVPRTRVTIKWIWSWFMYRLTTSPAVSNPNVSSKDSPGGIPSMLTRTRETRKSLDMIQSPDIDRRPTVTKPGEIKRRRGRPSKKPAAGQQSSPVKSSENEPQIITRKSPRGLSPRMPELRPQSVVKCSPPPILFEPCPVVSTSAIQVDDEAPELENSVEEHSDCDGHGLLIDDVASEQDNTHPCLEPPPLLDLNESVDSSESGISPMPVDSPESMDSPEPVHSPESVPSANGVAPIEELQPIDNIELDQSAIVIDKETEKQEILEEVRLVLTAAVDQCDSGRAQIEREKEATGEPGNVEDGALDDQMPTASEEDVDELPHPDTPEWLYPGSLVMCQFRPYPHWPAIVKSKKFWERLLPSDTKDSLQNFDSLSTYLVQFLPDARMQVMGKDKLMAYEGSEQWTLYANKQLAGLDSSKCKGGAKSVSKKLAAARRLWLPPKSDTQHRAWKAAIDFADQVLIRIPDKQHRDSGDRLKKNGRYLQVIDDLYDYEKQQDDKERAKKARLAESHLKRAEQKKHRSSIGDKDQSMQKLLTVRTEVDDDVKPPVSLSSSPVLPSPASVNGKSKKSLWGKTKGKKQREKHELHDFAAELLDEVRQKKLVKKQPFCFVNMKGKLAGLQPKASTAHGLSAEAKGKHSNDVNKPSNELTPFEFSKLALEDVMSDQPICTLSYALIEPNAPHYDIPVTCTGPCHRLFNKVSLLEKWPQSIVTETKGKKGQSNWTTLCEDCRLGVNGGNPCIVCSNVSTASNPTKACVVPACNRHVHPACLRTFKYAPGGQLFVNKLTDPNKIECPSHTCKTCFITWTERLAAEKDNAQSPGKKQQSPAKKSYLQIPYAEHERQNCAVTKCACCPVSYHSHVHCAAATARKLNTTDIICAQHEVDAQYLKQSKQKAFTKNKQINVDICQSCCRGDKEPLLCCEQCPMAYHPACVSLSAMPTEAWYCLACAHGHELHFNQLIWAKYGAARWWPSVVLHPADIPNNVELLNHLPGEFAIKFLGAPSKYGYVSRNRAYAIVDGDDLKAHIATGSSSVQREFMMGLQEAAAIRDRDKKCLKEKYVEQKEYLEVTVPKFKYLEENEYCTKERAELNPINACQCNALDWHQCTDPAKCCNKQSCIECTPEICGAAECCDNQNFVQGRYVLNAPFKTESRGWGLRALQHVRKGEFVIEYVGQVIDTHEMKHRMSVMNKNGDRNFYLLSLDATRFIDAGPAGNNARFMNHSCEPNCQPYVWRVEDDWRVGLFANTDIIAGSELTFNYRLDSRGVESKMQCECGASKCVGVISCDADDQDALVSSEMSGSKEQSQAKSARKVLKAQRKVKEKQEVPASILEAQKRCGKCDEKWAAKPGLIGCDTCHKRYHLTCLGYKVKPSPFNCAAHYCALCVEVHANKDKDTSTPCTNILAHCSPNNKTVDTPTRTRGHANTGCNNKQLAIDYPAQTSCVACDYAWCDTHVTLAAATKHVGEGRQRRVFVACAQHQHLLQELPVSTPCTLTTAPSNGQVNEQPQALHIEHLPHTAQISLTAGHAS